MNETFYNSPLGTLRLTASIKGVTRINFPLDKGQNEAKDREEIRLLNPHLKSAIQELDLYFNGNLNHFTTKLDPSGTPFQRSVWVELSKIPFGVTANYGEIAERLGNSGASRAVGMANNRNPISIIIPCHRIIGRDGKLIGYGGGIWRKEWLLRHEGSIL